MRTEGCILPWGGPFCACKEGGAPGAEPRFDGKIGPPHGGNGAFTENQAVADACIVCAALRHGRVSYLSRMANHTAYQRRQIRNSLYYMLFQYGLIAIALWWLPMRKPIFWVVIVGFVSQLLILWSERRRNSRRDRVDGLVNAVGALPAAYALFRPEWGTAALLAMIFWSLGVFVWRLCTRGWFPED